MKFFFSPLCWWWENVDFFVVSTWLLHKLLFYLKKFCCCEGSGKCLSACSKGTHRIYLTPPICPLLCFSWSWNQKAQHGGEENCRHISFSWLPCSDPLCWGEEVGWGSSSCSSSELKRELLLPLLSSSPLWLGKRWLSRQAKQLLLSSCLWRCPPPACKRQQQWREGRIRAAASVPFLVGPTLILIWSKSG